MKSNCTFEFCKNLRYKKDLCQKHYRKVFPNIFLSNVYNQISKRVRGIGGVKCPKLYIGKSLLPREDFYSFSKRDKHFLKLHKEWVVCNFNSKMTPVVRRIDTKKGYTLDNIEWTTFSQSSSLSGVTLKLKSDKSIIYRILGVKVNG